MSSAAGDGLASGRRERLACLTCSDDAVAVRVVSVEGAEAVVAAGLDGDRVAIDLVPDARPGDVLLCHAGIALERLEERA